MDARNVHFDTDGARTMALLSFLDREHTVANPGFSRWLVPTAALSIHLAIGQVYAFSVFKIPLNQLIGLSKPADGDWKQSQIAWVFSIAIIMLGLSAALFGKWLEGAGPRKAMFASAVCFSLGFFIAYFGVVLHRLWIIFLGYGVVGGIGLGLGYISPVSTLIKWFPDRPGLATGMAIMGFGGGAMIGSPLAVNLMARFRTPTDLGVSKTFLVMGTIYFLFMMFGVFTIRVPQPGWRPADWIPPVRQSAMITAGQMDVSTAFGTPQFWLIWVILCTNVTAGIGIIEQASPMIQDLFKGTIGPVAAGGFVGLLSLFNMGGRFFWSPTSDYIGRKATYFIFFALGGVLYFCLPYTGGNRLNSVWMFVATLRGPPEHVRRRLRDDPRIPARHVRQLPRQRRPRTPAHRLVHRRSPRPHAGELHPRIRTGSRRRPRRSLPGRPAHHGGTAGRRPDRQRHGAPRDRKILDRDRAALAKQSGGLKNSHQPMERTMTHQASRAALILLAWLFVGLSLGWGVYNTVRNSMKLFQKPAPPAVLKS